MSETISIATSAMMVELNISCWTARKLDKNVSKDIDAAKNTKRSEEHTSELQSH